MIKSWAGKGTPEFSEYRSYVMGDDLRKVDWNIYCRLHELVVKEYETEPPSHLFIILDISPSMNFREKFIYARAMAAALAYIGLSLLDKVTLLLLPQTTDTLQMTTRSGKRQILMLLNLLAKAAPQTPGNLKDMFIHLRQQLPRHLNTIILSDFYGDFFTALPLLNAPGNSCTAVQVLSHWEKSPQVEGDFLLQDMEDQQQQNIYIDSQRIHSYQQQLQRHLLQIKGFCGQHKISYALLEPEPELAHVLPLLRLSGILR